MREGWRRLIKSDVVAVLQSREDLEATFALPIFDSDSREYLQGCNFAFGEWVRRVAAETPKRRASQKEAFKAAVRKEKESNANHTKEIE